MKGLDHHLLCLMMFDINDVLINEVSKFLMPVPIETMCALQWMNPFDATQPIMIPLKLNGVTSFFEVRMPTQEDNEDQNILKIEVMAEVPPWDPSIIKFGR